LDPGAQHQILPAQCLVLITQTPLVGQPPLGVAGQTQWLVCQKLQGVDQHRKGRTQDPELLVTVIRNNQPDRQNRRKENPEGRRRAMEKQGFDTRTLAQASHDRLTGLEGIAGAPQRDGQ
jgi:hypothetical protein